MNSEEIISEFRKKNRVTTIIGYIYIILILLGIIVWQIYNIQLSYVIIALVGIVIPLNIFFFTYWTCPNCKSYLGGSENIEECPNCHFRFEKSNNTLRIDQPNNYKTTEINSSSINANVENIVTFPEYTKYNTYRLVEIYQRIDHRRNPKKIKIIEDIVRQRLSIDPLIDLDSSDIKKQFSTILEDEKPKTINEIENSEISKILGWFQIVLIIGIIITLLLIILGKKNNITLNVMMLLLAVILFIEFIKGFYSDDILTLWRSTVNLKESPVLFRLNQSLLILFFILIVLGVFKNL